MVMADFHDRDRGRNRRKRGFRRGSYHRGYRGDRENEEDEEEDYPRLASPKTPIILAKPSADKVGNLQDVTNNHVIEKELLSTPHEPEIILKAKEEPVKPKVLNNTQNNITSMLANDTMPAHAYRNRKSSGATLMLEGSIQARLAGPPVMPQAMKLIDENLAWCEGPMEMLMDQTDFFTVGVLGLQGVGKSTLLSLLAGNTKADDFKTMMFKPQSKDIKETCSHQTSGVDMYVTGERMVLLDTQPLLSASLLDGMIHQDKKYSAEFSYSENCVEVQSLQLSSFLMTVCNVLLVVVDWFVDINLLRFLLAAEMLKPATPSGGQDNHETEHNEYFPHIVFVLNKAGSEDFDTEVYSSMQATLSKACEKSKLNYKGVLNMVDSKLMRRDRCEGASHDVNLLLLSDFKDSQQEKVTSGVFSLLPEYKGHHSFDHSMKTLGNRLFAMPRKLLTHTTLSEKNWFHYAARTWEGVKKSTLLSEYNRLLP